MIDTTLWPLILRLLAAGIPLTLAVGALRASSEAPFRSASRSAGLAAGLALVVAVLGPWFPLDVGSDSSGVAWALHGALRLDAVTSVMIALVTAIGVVIVRYSIPYLDRDPGQLRYERALLGTLAAVCLLVISNDLWLLGLAWMVSSLTLHQLLTHFQDRTAALIAAHKKYLLSRLADACVLGAVALLYGTVGSTHLDELSSWAAGQDRLPLTAEIAALLFVGGVALKTAQLPFHGWLTQVMEAPTPVSALLHAGVVNIGGFVLIRLSGLMEASPAALTTLVIIGLTTTVLAALVMTTRVSVKVGLAWSTAAQMGLMLVQCGLGAWHLALLHLVAHSLYKAHAFLSAGNTVDTWRIKAMSPTSSTLPVHRVVLATLVTVPLVLGASLLVSHLQGTSDPTVLPLGLILAFALAPMLARLASAGLRPLAGGITLAVLVAALYLGGHVAFEGLHLGHGTGFVGATLAWVLVVPAFTLLLGIQTVLQAHPHGRLARALHPALFSGFFLDEHFTRLTFRIWPPRLPTRPASIALQPVPETQEA